MAELAERTCCCSDSKDMDGWMFMCDIVLVDEDVFAEPAQASQGQTGTFICMVFPDGHPYGARILNSADV